MNSAVERLQGSGISEKVDGFEIAYRRWMETAYESMELAESRAKLATQSILEGEGRTAFGELRNYFDIVGAHADEQAQLSASRASDKAMSRSVMILVISIATVAICIALFVIFLRLIVGAVRQLKDQLDNIARARGI